MSALFAFSRSWRGCLRRVSEIGRRSRQAQPLRCRLYEAKIKHVHLKRPVARSAIAVPAGWWLRESVMSGFGQTLPLIKARCGDSVFHSRTYGYECAALARHDGCSTNGYAGSRLISVVDVRRGL